MNNITIYTVPDGDWQAMYVNEINKQEEHRIRIEDIAKWCPIASIKEVYLTDYFTEDDCFPLHEASMNVEWIIG